MIRTEPLFENIFLGQQKTPNGVYEWNDINIQAGIGDTVIDLSLYDAAKRGNGYFYSQSHWEYSNSCTL